MNDAQILTAICEIRDLLRLIAEPQIAARDQKLQNDLVQIVGNSDVKRKAVLAMDGGRTQLAIHKETGMHKGNLSTLVKQLGQRKLLTGDPKTPKLSITIPTKFFDQTGRTHG
jgi:hypothetical protein